MPDENGSQWFANAGKTSLRGLVKTPSGHTRLWGPPLSLPLSLWFYLSNYFESRDDTSYWRSVFVLFQSRSYLLFCISLYQEDAQGGCWGQTCSTNEWQPWGLPSPAVGAGVARLRPGCAHLWLIWNTDQIWISVISGHCEHGINSASIWRAEWVSSSVEQRWYYLPICVERWWRVGAG